MQEIVILLIVIIAVLASVGVSSHLRTMRAVKEYRRRVKEDKTP